MTRKNLSFLVLILAIVILGILFSLATLSERRIERVKEKELKAFFPGLKEENLGYVKFEKDGKVTQLKKENDRWLVKLSEEKWFPANPVDTQEMLSYFIDLKPAEVIAKGEDKLEKFDLTEEKALKVYLATSPEDENPFRLNIGKTGPDFRSTYAVRAGDTTVFLLSENKNSTWQKEPKEWRDKYPFRERPELVSKITVTNQKETFTLEKSKEGIWEFTYPGDKTADSTVVSEFLSRLANLVAMSLVDEPNWEEKVEPPDFTYELKVLDRDVSLRVSSETEDSKRYVYNDELEQLYLLSASTWVGIPRNLDEFVLKEEKKPAKKESDEQGKTVEKDAKDKGAKEAKKGKGSGD